MFFLKYKIDYVKSTPACLCFIFLRVQMEYGETDCIAQRLTYNRFGTITRNEIYALSNVGRDILNAYWSNSWTQECMLILPFAKEKEIEKVLIACELDILGDEQEACVDENIVSLSCDFNILGLFLPLQYVTCGDSCRCAIPVIYKKNDTTETLYISREDASWILSHYGIFIDAKSIGKCTKSATVCLNSKQIDSRMVEWLKEYGTMNRHSGSIYLVSLSVVYNHIQQNSEYRDQNLSLCWTAFLNDVTKYKMNL